MYKKQVIFSTIYDSTVDDKATKLNVLVDDIVNLILENNSSLSIIDRITYGSDEMNGAPGYMGGSTGVSDVHIPKFESDIVIIGTNKDNFCLGVNFANGVLVLSIVCGVDKANAINDSWQSYANVTSYAFSPIALECNYVNRGYWEFSQYVLPYVVDSNNVIKITVQYTSTDLNQIYRFINGNSYMDNYSIGNLYITKQTNDNYAFILDQRRVSNLPSYRNPRIICVGFDEEIPINMSNTKVLSNADKITYNTHFNPYSFAWASTGSSTRNGEGAGLYHTSYGIRGTTDWNNSDNTAPGIGLVRARSMFVNNMDLGDYTSTNNIYHLARKDISYNFDSYDIRKICSFNLPILSEGQAWLRQVYHPVSLTNQKLELYYFYTPLITAFTLGDIYEVDGHRYMVAFYGLPCVVAKLD